MKGIIDISTVIQIAFVVKDIEASKKKYAEFLGIDVPDHMVTQKSPINFVKGKSAPDISAMLAFLPAGPNLTIELIQPNGVSSVWQDVLDEQGEGFHHIAFGVKDIAESVAAAENYGMECLQQGGGYAYLDSREDLKCIIELLPR